MTGPYAELIRVLEAQLKDADKTHAKTLFEYHEMKARAEAAEKRVTMLEDHLSTAIDRAEAAEKREAVLRKALEKIAGRDSTINAPANRERTVVYGEFGEIASAALEAKP